MTDQFVLVHHTQLRRHSRNMRREYPLAQVRRMAISQAARARKGEAACVQPLIVTVAGHLRHAGNEKLGLKAPPLNCIVRFYATEADMLADMGTENGVRADPGLLGWAHYIQQRLNDGVKMHELLQQTGLALNRVSQLQQLLTLAPAVQKLIDGGQLPLGAVGHLTRVADPAIQVTLAQKLAEQSATIRDAEMAVNALFTSGAAKPKTTQGARKRTATPALEGLPEALPATTQHVRQAAAKACGRCELSAGRMSEPAWHIALAAAGHACKECGLQAYNDVCKACPLAMAMKDVVQAVVQAVAKTDVKTDVRTAQKREVPA